MRGQPSGNQVPVSGCLSASRVVGGIQGITFEHKHNAKGGGTAKWRAKVDAVPLEIITPAVVLSWKNARLRAVESDPLAKRRATITVNSTLWNAKSLFGKKLLPFIEQELPLPVPLPFEGGIRRNPRRCATVSKIDAFAILARAKDELAETDPEGFKVLKPLLTMRKEIGSIIASEHGIFEASRYLRHSDNKAAYCKARLRIPIRLLITMQTSFALAVVPAPSSLMARH
ncbi:MAG: hypothetical protein QM680_09255 [Luteolibacter sp.]